MPELPEVETVRRQLDEKIAGKTIQEICLFRSGRERPVGQKFVRLLTGQTIERVDRRAKILIWRLTDSRAVIAHLKMTGRFVFVPKKYQRQKHDRALFVFDDQAHLVWSDVRQFGFMHIVDQSTLHKILMSYGLEPLEVSLDVLAERLRAPVARQIKAALLNQQVIAGVGNIYADEACHRAGIRPTRRLGALSGQDRSTLAHHIQSVLRESIEQQGTSANDYVDTRGERGGFLDLLRVYGRAGQPCLTCGSPIKKIVLAQRGTHYCPICQK